MVTKHTVREEATSHSSGHTKAPEFPVDFDRSTSTDHIPSHQEQRPCSDPVNVSHSSVLKGSYIGEVARSLGHCNEEHLLSFARLRQSSSMPNICDRQHYLEQDSESVEKKTVDDSICSGGKRAGSVSPEISGLMLQADRDSDNSETLTDDSVSHTDDFSFPPVQEIGAVTVTLSSDFPENQTVVKPKLIEMKEKDGLLHPEKSKFEQTVSPKSGLLSSGSHRSEEIPQHIWKPVIVTNIPEQVKESTFAYPEWKDPTDARNEALTDSIDSEVSSPHPHISHDISMATLPISSSAMDIVVLLQRMVGLGKVLCRTLTPARHGYDSDQSAFSSLQDEDFHIPPVFIKPRQKLYESFLNVS